MIGSFWFNSFSAGGAPAGGTDYELISTTVLGSNTASVTFSGIDTTTYKHLQIRMTARSTSSGNMHLRINSDTAANYAWHRLKGDGASATSSAGSSTSFIQLSSIATETSIFAPAILDILDAGSTSKAKTLRAFVGRIEAGSSDVNLRSGGWFSTSAITSLSLSDLTSGSSFTTGSRFSLYGLK